MTANSAIGLTRRFGELDAVAGIDLQIEPGEINGLLGRNGAGESTTVRMLGTLLGPTSGTAAVAIALVGTASMSTCLAALRSRVRTG